MASGVVIRPKGTHMTGPIRSINAGRPGAAPAQTSGRQAVVTVTSLATLVAETYTITDADALLGDVITVSPNATPPVGWNLQAAWVSANGTISVRASNAQSGAITGAPLTLNYTITR